MSKPTSVLHKILEGFPWPSELRTMTPYRRLHDDHDGTREGELIVQFTPDGDAWVYIDKLQGASLRFRFSSGGGNSPRVRNALVLLALAIKLDSEDRPD
jgi:hypothetical protein